MDERPLPRRREIKVHVRKEPENDPDLRVGVRKLLYEHIANDGVRGDRPSEKEESIYFHRAFL
ncbi:hypothetical protein [Natronorubrum halophilum]|uniref:hypothetical protein n=1 Tax=Natronorubrum halophilum TaxID=1702106 RepID=UPI0030B851C3